MAPDRARAWRQLALSYLITNGLVFALSRRVAREFHLDELIGALFLAAAVLSIRADDDDTERYGVRLGGVFAGKAGDDRSLPRTIWEGIPLAARELAIALCLAAVVLPVYAAFWPLFNHPVGPRHFTLDAARWREIATNLLAVALTEELYFRGYLQTRLGDAFGVPRDLRAQVRAGAQPRGALWRAMALPVVVTSALFALTHVTVEPTVARAVVFFPGLLFGAVRVWRGGIGAAVFLHAIANLFEMWLEGR